MGKSRIIKKLGFPNDNKNFTLKKFGNINRIEKLPIKTVVLKLYHLVYGCTAELIHQHKVYLVLNSLLHSPVYLAKECK